MFVSSRPYLNWSSWSLDFLYRTNNFTKSWVCSFRWILTILQRAGVNVSIAILLWGTHEFCTNKAETSTPLGLKHESEVNCRFDYLFLIDFIHFLCIPTPNTGQLYSPFHTFAEVRLIVKRIIARQSTDWLATNAQFSPNISPRGKCLLVVSPTE